MSNGAAFVGVRSEREKDDSNSPNSRPDSDSSWAFLILDPGADSESGGPSVHPRPFRRTEGDRTLVKTEGLWKDGWSLVRKDSLPSNEVNKVFTSNSGRDVVRETIHDPITVLILSLLWDKYSNVRPTPSTGYLCILFRHLFW